MDLIKYTQISSIVSEKNYKPIVGVLILLILFLMVSNNIELNWIYGVETPYTKTDTINNTIEQVGMQLDITEVAQVEEPKYSVQTHSELIDKPYINFLWGETKNDKNLNVSSIKKYVNEHNTIITQESERTGIPSTVLMALFIYHGECNKSIVSTRYNNFFDIRNIDKTKYITFDTKWNSIHTFATKLKEQYNSNAKPSDEDWFEMSCDILQYTENSDIIEYKRRLNSILKKIM